jgi:hypothetical protein
MGANFNITGSYNITNRSGSNLSVEVAIDVDLSGDGSSFYNYDVQYIININGVDYPGELKPNGVTWYGGTGRTATASVSINVGTGSGSISVSARAYSDLDEHPADNTGATAYGNIGFGSTNTAPSTPGYLSPTSGVYKDSIALSWGASGDNEGNLSGYHVIVSKNTWGNWTEIATTGATSYTYDISGDPEGTRYYFGVQAYDSSGATSTWQHGGDENSITIYKNVKPNPPTTLLPLSGHFEGSIDLSWSGASDPEGQAIVYDVEVSKDGGAWTVVSAGQSGTTYTYNILAGDAEGATYKFRVRSKDTFNVYSDYKTMVSVCTKNYKPTVPADINPDSGYYENTISISWSVSSDTDGDTIEYELQISKDDAAWVDLSTNLSVTNYTYTTTSDARGTRYKFRVLAKDDLGAKSAYVTTTGYARRNQLPVAPSLNYPVGSATIFDTTPRLAITINTDADNHDQKLFVYWINTWYNSQDNPTLFSKTGSQANGTKVVFRPTVACSLGSTTIKVKTNDGYADSPETTVTVTISDDSVATTLTTGVTSTKTILDNIRSDINDARAAYGLSAVAWTDGTIVAGQTPFKEEHINEPRTGIENIIDLLDGWDPTNSNLLGSTSWSMDTTGDYNVGSEFEAVLSALKSI